MSRLVDTLRTDIGDFSSLSPQIKFLLGFQIVILFCLSFLVGIIFSPKFKSQVSMRTGMPLKTVPTAAPTVHNALSVFPAKSVMKVGEKQLVTVSYDGIQPEVVDTVISYDPTVLRVDGVKAGQLFDTTLQNKIDKGHIIFSAALSLEKLAKKPTSNQKGTLFSFTITALKPDKGSNLAIVKEETFAWNDRNNILSEVSGTLIDITR